MEIDRYQRQFLLPQIGTAGQHRLARSRVLLVGCGALGSVIADQLVRAGVGMLRLADRDVVELTNLQRQVLFDEQDAREQTPKAIAAARRLDRINSSITIEPFVIDVHAANVEALAGVGVQGHRVDLILDGTDNVETRYLLNEVSVKHGIPWVYGGCVETEGRCMGIRPGVSACLRCLFPQPPRVGELPTCDTAGVLGPAAAIVASLQVVAGLKLLIDDAHEQHLITLDPWQGRFKSVCVTEAKRQDCPACARREFEFLNRMPADRSTSLCGRNAIQIRPAAASIDLGMLAEKLRNVGTVQQTPYLVRCDVSGSDALRLTVFSDGRAIIHGTADPERARSVYARFVGA